MSKDRKRVSTSVILNLVTGVNFAIVALAVVVLVNFTMKNGVQGGGAQSQDYS